MDKRYLIQDRFNAYMDILTEVTGMDAEAILSTRRYPTSYYRAMLAEALHSDGFSTVFIGEMLRRDHSTVLHGFRKLNSAKECPSGSRR